MFEAESPDLINVLNSAYPPLSLGLGRRVWVNRFG